MGMQEDQRLVLASGSPRRRDLLERLGLHFDVAPPDVDESVRAGEDSRTYVLRLAQAKADQIARARPRTLVLAADTAVVLEGEILGKPAGTDDARAMLRRLSGRIHLVLTAVAIAGEVQQSLPPIVVETRVKFRAISDDEIGWYVGTGEPFDKAGGYGIQGIGGAFASAIDGSASNVIGLPLAETIELLSLARFVFPWTRGRK
jgi:septum formation protein